MLESAIKFVESYSNMCNLPKVWSLFTAAKDLVMKLHEQDNPPVRQT